MLRISLVSAGAMPNWWGQTEATTLAALVALAAATCSIFMERRRAQERRDSIDQRVAGLALAFHRSLQKALDGWPDKPNRSFADHLVCGFDDMQDWVVQMIHYAPEGTDQIATAAQQAAEAFWRGADNVNDVQARQYALRPVPDAEVPKRMSNAKSDFEESAEHLDTILELWPEDGE